MVSSGQPSVLRAEDHCAYAVDQGLIDIIACLEGVLLFTRFPNLADAFLVECAADPGTHMRDRKEGHLDTDERVCQCQGHVFPVGISSD